MLSQELPRRVRTVGGRGEGGVKGRKGGKGPSSFLVLDVQFFFLPLLPLAAPVRSSRPLSRADKAHLLYGVPCDGMAAVAPTGTDDPPGKHSRRDTLSLPERAKREINIRIIAWRYVRSLPILVCPPPLSLTLFTRGTHVCIYVQTYTGVSLKVRPARFTPQRRATGGKRGSSSFSAQSVLRV